MNQILKEALSEEAELRYPAFDEEDAWVLGCLMAERARKEGLPVAIDISLKDRVLFHCSLPGTSPDNDQWVIRKKNAVHRFGHSSWYLGRKLEEEGATLEGRYYVSEREYSAHGGSFPLTVTGTGIIGSVTVSGLPQEADHALVVSCIRSHLAELKAH